MDWLNIKEVLPPETLRDILGKHEILMIKYYPKPRQTTNRTTILLEVLNKDKEIVPTIIEVCESKPYFSNEHYFSNEQDRQVSIIEKTIRCRDRDVFSREEINKIGTIFKLLGLKVY